ncbi:MAG: cation:proton antiporter [Lachnospiraceae bacterium]|nr:cation:proton antiporter [Lachnospiraceae bacterium]
METYKFLLDLAMILLSTKLLGLVTRKFNMPQVVGALLAGLILGPGMFDVISQTDFIQKTAEVGVVVLMFCAGMETDVEELKKSGKASFVIALIGVVVPLIGGYLVAAAFNRPGVLESDASCSSILQNIFIGVILTATSVSITVETLKELGKLKTHSGNAILGAAVIDDILGIIALTVITSMADSSVKISIVLLKIVGFFVFAAVAGYLFYQFYSRWCNLSNVGLQRHTIVAFVFCLVMAYVAEEFFGVADITGAYIAGIIISMTQKEPYLASRFDIVSYLYLSPIFFASIGLKVVLPKMNGTIIAFAVILTVVAILTKVVGCGLGAKLCHYKNYQAIRIGVGMISRGEVALIVASKGEALGLMGTQLMGPVVIVVIITTIIAPILLKPVFKMGPASVPSDNNKLAEGF